MRLLWIVLAPIVGGPLAWALGFAWPRAARILSTATLVIGLGLTVWAGAVPTVDAISPWWYDLSISWMPSFGVRIHLALDGLSFPLVLLTFVLGLVAIAASWKEIGTRVGLFHLMLLWVLGGVLGVFLSVDLFLFYFFWEMMLVPMYFLIGLWGHERRVQASIKFMIYTQTGGLLMLLGLAGIAFAGRTPSGLPTFDYGDLLALRLGGRKALWILLGFLTAFAVKIPMIPFHAWLPDAHTEAPTAGSILLAGLLLKTGAYGVLRFLVPLFAQPLEAIAPAGRILGVAGILYGAFLAYGQTDLKRLVAYTSVSHMGFVILGSFAGGTIALGGVLVQMIAHGLTTGALFVLVGILQDRLGTRDLREMGGFWASAPRMGSATLVFALASLGLPGLGNFVGEFLVLLGVYPRDPWAAGLATAGLVLATIYSLRLFQAPFQGPRVAGPPCADLSFREGGILACLLAITLALGLYPQRLLGWGAGPLGRLGGRGADTARGP